MPSSTNVEEDGWASNPPLDDLGAADDDSLEDSSHGLPRQGSNPRLNASYYSHPFRGGGNREDPGKNHNSGKSASSKHEKHHHHHHHHPSREQDKHHKQQKAEVRNSGSSGSGGSLDLPPTKQPPKEQQQVPLQVVQTSPISNANPEAQQEDGDEDDEDVNMAIQHVNSKISSNHQRTNQNNSNSNMSHNDEDDDDDDQTSIVDFATYFGGGPQTPTPPPRPQTTDELIVLQEKKRAMQEAAEKARERLHLKQQRQEFKEQELQKRQTIMEDLDLFDMLADGGGGGNTDKKKRSNDSSSVLDMDDLDSHDGHEGGGGGGKKAAAESEANASTANDHPDSQQQQQQQQLSEEKIKAKEEAAAEKKRQEELRLQQEFRQVIQRSLYGQRPVSGDATATTSGGATQSTTEHSSSHKKKNHGPRKNVRFQMDHEEEDDKHRKLAKSPTRKPRRDTRKPENVERLTQSFSSLQDHNNDMVEGSDRHRRSRRATGHKPTSRKSTAAGGERASRRTVLRRNSSDGDLQRMRASSNNGGTIRGSSATRDSKQRSGGSMRASRTTGGDAVEGRTKTTSSSVRSSRTSASSGETNGSKRRSTRASRTTTGPSSSTEEADATTKPMSKPRPPTPAATKRNSLTEKIAASLTENVSAPQAAAADDTDVKPKPSRRKLLRKNSSCGDIEDRKAARKKKRPSAGSTSAASKTATTTPSAPKSSKGSKSERGMRRSLDTLILDDFDSSNLDIDMLLQTTLTEIGTRATEDENNNKDQQPTTTTTVVRRKLLRRNSSEGDLQRVADKARKSQKATSKHSRADGTDRNDSVSHPNDSKLEGESKQPANSLSKEEGDKNSERAKNHTKGNRRKLLRKNSSDGDLATKAARKARKSRKPRSSDERMNQSLSSFDRSDRPPEASGFHREQAEKPKTRHRKVKEVPGEKAAEGKPSRRKLLRKTSSDGDIRTKEGKSRKSRKPKAEQASLRMNQSMNNLNNSDHLHAATPSLLFGNDKDNEKSAETPAKSSKKNQKAQAGSQQSEQSPDVTASTTITPASPQEENQKQPARPKLLRSNSSDGDLAKMRKSRKGQAKRKTGKRGSTESGDGSTAKHDGGKDAEKAMHQSLSLFKEVEDALYQRKAQSQRATRSSVTPDELEMSPSRRTSHGNKRQTKERSKRSHRTSQKAASDGKEHNEVEKIDAVEMEVPRVKPIITKLSLSSKNKAISKSEFNASFASHEWRSHHKESDSNRLHQSVSALNFEPTTSAEPVVGADKEHGVQSPVEPDSDIRVKKDQMDSTVEPEVDTGDVKGKVDNRDAPGLDDNTSVSSLEFPPISTKERTAKSRRFENPLDGVEVPPIPTSIALAVAEEPPSRTIAEKKSLLLETKLKKRWSRQTYFDERSQSEVVDMAACYDSLDLTTSRELPTWEDRRHSSMTALALDASVINGQTKRYQRIRESLVASSLRGKSKSLKSVTEKQAEGDGHQAKKSTENAASGDEGDEAADEDALKWKRRLSAHVLLKEVAKGKHLAVKAHLPVAKQEVHEKAVKHIHDKSRALFSELTEQKRQEEPQENFWDVVKESYDVRVGGGSTDTGDYLDTDDDISSKLPPQEAPPPSR